MKGISISNTLTAVNDRSPNVTHLPSVFYTYFNSIRAKINKAWTHVRRIYWTSPLYRQII